MIKLEMLQNQIADTKKLISDTRRLKMFDSSNSVIVCSFAAITAFNKIKA